MGFVHLLHDTNQQPPGTTKFDIVAAAAYESQCTMLSVSGADLVSKWVDEGEQ